MRYRKGPKGLYYTDGNIDRCTYNDVHANIFQLIHRERISKYDISELVEHLIAGLQGLLFLLVSPIVPIIRVIYLKKNIKDKDVPVQRFSKDYYEEV